MKFVFAQTSILTVLVLLFIRAPAVAGLPLFQQTGSVLVMSNGNVKINYNLTSGRADFYWKNVRKIAGFYSGVGLESYITGTMYPSRTWSSVSNNQVVITSSGNGYPLMKQYFILNREDSFLTRVEMSGAGLSSSWMGPVVMDSTGGVDIGSYNDVRALYVPFDNDGWARYDAMSINNTSVSYEVCAFYDNTTRNGLVVGSVTHDTWKTGIYFSGSANKLNAMNVFGGATSPSVTWDVMPHGAVVGNTISSPTAFVGFGTDWRTTIEAFADENAALTPRLAWTNGVPFGWNSWFAYTSSVSYDKVIAVSDFLKTNLQTAGFSNDGVVYVNLDSYWDNMSSAQLLNFVQHCHANGQKAGIYWSPFVWWGSAGNLGSSTVEGSTYKYSEAALRTSSGEIQTNDGAIAMDPTHPAIKRRVDYYIGRFLSQGFDYIKLDFLSHGAMEGIHYDTNVTTGIQAYNQGMRYVYNRINGKMFISESIAPIFPYQYGHSRRIACDTARSIGETEYEMQSVTYGWWINRRLYQFNDPDMMAFSGATAFENQSRLISAAVSGTVFLNSDDLASPTGQNLARTCLTNAAINALARAGLTFRPMEGNTGNKAATVFVGQDATNSYIAIFNYTSSAVDRSVDLARVGVTTGTAGAIDLWSGAVSSITGEVLRTRLEARQSKLFRLVSIQSAQESRATGIESLGNNSRRIGFSGWPGYAYLVKFSTNLSANSWSLLSTNVADPTGLWEVIDNNATNGMRFYHSVYRY